MDEPCKRLKSFVDSADLINTEAVTIGEVSQKLVQLRTREFIRSVADHHAVPAIEKRSRDRRREHTQANQCVSSQFRRFGQMFLEPGMGQQMDVFLGGENL